MATAVSPELAAKKAAETPEAAPMKAAISLSNLKQALKIVGMAIERTATIPILQCVRMEQIPDGLALEATTLNVYVRAVVKELGGPEKPVVIPAEKFTAWTKLLAGDDVKISATDRRATMQCGRSRAVLPVMPAASWPSNEVYGMKAEGITLTQGDFARALRFVMIAVCQEESRYTLNGVLLQGDGERLRLVATDGHRLMAYTLPCTEKITLLLPSRFIKALLPLLNDEDGGVDLCFSDRMILSSIDADMRVYVASTKLTGQFPNWEAVMPSGKRTEITVNAKEMLASLERCGLLSDERSGCVRLTFDEQITIEASSSQSGEATETVDCKGHPQQKLYIGVNGAYLTDLVKRLDGEITISLPDTNQSPLLIKATPHEGETLGYVVMPMRV
jgi:DNA polymerase-3 subunit beta